MARISTACSRRAGGECRVFTEKFLFKQVNGRWRTRWAALWIQTVDLFVPETQPSKRAHIPQTTNLQTLWSLKYSIDIAWLSVKQAAAVSTQQNEMSLCESVDLWFCLARALEVHLLGGLWICDANKQQPLQNHLSHLNHSDLLCGSAQCTAGVVSVDAVAWRKPKGHLTGLTGVWRAAVSLSTCWLLAGFDVQFFLK